MAIRQTYYQWQIDNNKKGVASAVENIASVNSTVNILQNNYAALVARVATLENTVSLIDGNLTTELQNLIADIVATGVWIPKKWTGTTPVDGKEVTFPAPPDITSDGSLGLVLIDNLAYKIVSQEEWDSSDEQACILQGEPGKQTVLFRYAPQPSMYDDGTVARTVLRFNYFISAAGSIDP
jgi:hypothetical protein